MARADVTKDGKLLMTGRGGDFIGDISLIARSERRASAVARTPMRVLVLTSHHFLGLLSSNSGMELKVPRSLAKRVFAASNVPTL